MSDDTPAEVVTRQDVASLRESVDAATAAVGREANARLEETEALRLKFYTARRAMRVAILAMVLGFFVNLSLFFKVQHEQNAREQQRRDAAVVSCLNANQSRAAIEGRFEQFTVLLSNFNPPTTPEAQAARDQALARFLERLRESVPASLQPRDCSPDAATQPTLVTPTTVG